jgi:hypothetical protein
VKLIGYEKFDPNEQQGLGWLRLQKNVNKKKTIESLEHKYMKHSSLLESET